MTIHHDKLAYGRLAKTSEEMSEADIEKMLKELYLPEEKEKNGLEENDGSKPQEGDKK